jgi:ABC-type sugar transport system ATPase subunit
MRVKLENLTKYFGKVVGAEDVNLKIKDGEFVALLGPSGCGKTTTLLMIAGIYKPTRGYVYFDDKIVNDLLPKDRNVGMVFQSYALYPHMTVFNNITFPLKLKKVPKGEMKQRAQKVAEMLQIEELMDRKPAQLSGGQQQRVAVARALVKEPDILLFDEPLSNLDAKLRIQMRAELKRLQMELGITTIYVTHDQVEAMTMSDRIAVMQAGHLQQYSTPEELYDRPQNLFVAGFIGSPPMNFMEVRLEESDGRYSLKRGSFELEIPTSKGAIASKKARGADVVMGIRPEDIEIVSREKGIPAEVYVTEPLGRDLLIDLKLAGTDVRVLADPSLKAEVGEVVGLKFNSEKVHLFDPETEESLLL